MINKLNKNSEQILKARYYINEKENWSSLCNRVVYSVVPEKEGETDRRQECLYMINHLLFMPNSPTLFNAGTKNPMLSACFIIDVEDSLSRIFDAIRDSAIIHKFGGGVGFSLHKLRIRGSKITTTHGQSSGSCSFLRAFSEATRPITAGGKRKGANMCQLPIYHGDIEEFIALKAEEGLLDNFNISTTVPDSFILAAKENREVYLIDPKDNKTVKTINAADLLRKIAELAHSNGEPGITFIDTVNADNPTPHLGKIHGSNPCQPSWAPLLTPEGVSRFADVCVGSIIWSGKRWTTIVRKINMGIKPVYVYHTESGLCFIGTEEHRVYDRGVKLPVKDALSIDTCCLPGNDFVETKINKIVSREYVGEHEVFNITVDDPEHTYCTDGLLVSNCGEFYSIVYNSCNLGSINLFLHLNDENKIDWDKLKNTVKTATYYLDCVIDANKYPLDVIDKVSKSTRPVGLGVFGFADMLIKMNIKYDSEEAFKLAEEISEFISYHSLWESSDLAKNKGSYHEFRPENHKYERYVGYGKLNWKSLVKKIEKDGLRNSHTTVIAPTGTIARIANEASWGIEPVFSFSYESNILDGKKQTFNHPLYQDFLDKKLDVNKGVFVSAREIHWRDHINMQAAWQRFVQNGISKTINMPNSATVDEVLQAYMYAHEKGTKGITIYREGSRKSEVLVSSDRSEQDKGDKKTGRKLIEIDTNVLKKLVLEKKMSAAELSDIFDCSVSTIRKRVKELGLITKLGPEKIKCPEELDAKRYKVETPSGTLYIEVGIDGETKFPIETILNISRSGTSVNAVAEALGKMVSKALQHRVDPYEIIDTLKDIVGGDNVSWWRGHAIKSVPDALAQVLEVYMKSHVDKGEDLDEIRPKDDLSSGPVCPSCGIKLTPQEGCYICSKCSYSKCG